MDQAWSVASASAQKIVPSCACRVFVTRMRVSPPGALPESERSPWPGRRAVVDPFPMRRSAAAAQVTS